MRRAIRTTLARMAAEAEIVLEWIAYRKMAV
jgi:hypothetical protein